MHGNITETTQFLLSCESSEELRSKKFDETNVLTGARSLRLLSQMSDVQFSKEMNNIRWPKVTYLF